MKELIQKVEEMDDLLKSIIENQKKYQKNLELLCNDLGVKNERVQRVQGEDTVYQ